MVHLPRACFPPAVVVATLAVVLPAIGQEPTPTPSPTPTPRPKAESRKPATALSEIAARIRLKKPTPAAGGGAQTVTITDDNIGDIARRGALTQATGTGQAVSGDTGVGEGEGEPDAQKVAKDTRRQYWRNKYSAQSKLIEEMEARIRELDREIPRLWDQFYAWDDPAYRDSVIKPELDSKLQEREGLAARLPDERGKLDQILQDARRDGAEPGWFRNLDRD